eukprot:TRINITY_DN183_c0_g2_i1.p1 TRINITY_DN183_c0_g2~~TRINITY_DN183_c0_g2_i1.p1  ORF type:complete len:231 (+),score=1.12 TRINITY_DN183_c0_g2_i1:289-981(+)
MLPYSRQVSSSHRQLSPVKLSLAVAAVLLSFAEAVSARCNPLRNCNAEGYCCCSNSAFYSARPVGQTCQRHFRGYMFAVVIVPIFVGLAFCLLVSYWQRKRIASLRPNSYQTGPDLNPAPVPYIAGPGAYAGGPPRYPPGPGAYADPAMPYQGAPGGYHNGSAAYGGGPGAYGGGPGAYQGGPGAYDGGPSPGYGQQVYGTPVMAYPPAAHLPEDRYKEATAPYRSSGNA